MTVDPELLKPYAQLALGSMPLDAAESPYQAEREAKIAAEIELNSTEGLVPHNLVCNTFPTLMSAAPLPPHRGESSPDAHIRASSSIHSAYHTLIH